MSRQIETIFHEVCGLSADARADYFARNAIPEDLRLEVESLLAHDGATDSPLMRRVVSRADAWMRGKEGDASFGPFRLKRLLGGGGMGDVYLAERADGEVQQTVAVKFLRFGAESPVLRERFLRERQILASLRHDGIAHFLDAGHGADGRPFLVMEYVDGVPIDTYCASLPLRRKLELFLQVCDAVSYAHRNLVVHRDIKPSNILVETTGRVKLLDFGIARMLDDSADQTRTRERLLTPEYASPEQVKGMAQSTSTDIYSLGAVLYKLLTGVSPHSFDSTTGEQIDWVIATREPQPASQFNSAVPKDLDFILSMALRKEAEARYGTVEMLMEDVSAFLEHRPVRARSRDSWYRLTRFLRRFWLPAAAGSVAVAGLTVGLVIAQKQRALAERRFNDVRHLSQKLLDVDVLVRQLPGSSTVRQFVVNTSLDYLRRLSQDAAGDPDLALELGTAYMRVGRVQGVSISTHLGQSANAEENLRIAEGLIQSVSAARPANRLAMLRAAQIAHDRMILAQERRPNTEALPLARTSAQWLDKYLNSGDVKHAAPVEADGIAIVGMNVANWFSHEGLTDEAIRLSRRTIEVATATKQTQQAGAARIVLARTLRDSGDLEGALAVMREGTALMQPNPGETSVGILASYGLALITEGEILGEDEDISLGRYEEAASLFERGYEIALNQARRDEKDVKSRQAVLDRGLRLAGVLRHKDPAAALRIYDEALRYISEVKNNARARRGEVRALAASAQVLVDMGRAAEARKRLDDAFTRLRELRLYPTDSLDFDSEAGTALRAAAVLQAKTGNLAKAIETYNELLKKGMTDQSSVQSDLHLSYQLSQLYVELAALYRRTGQTESARSITARRQELWKHWEQKLPQRSFLHKQVELASN